MTDNDNDNDMKYMFDENYAKISAGDIIEIVVTGIFKKIDGKFKPVQSGSKKILKVNSDGSKVLIKEISSNTSGGKSSKTTRKLNKINKKQKTYKNN